MRALLVFLVAGALGAPAAQAAGEPVPTGGGAQFGAAPESPVVYAGAAAGRLCAIVQRAGAEAPTGDLANDGVCDSPDVSGLLDPYVLQDADAGSPRLLGGIVSSVVATVEYRLLSGGVIDV